MLLKNTLFLLLTFYFSICQGQYIKLGFIDCNDNNEKVIDLDVFINDSIYAQNSDGFIEVEKSKGEKIYIKCYAKNSQFLFDTIYTIDKSITYFCVSLATDLEQVTVYDRRSLEISPGIMSIDKKFIESSSFVLGEKDVLKAIQFLPGISAMQEGSTFYSVRGGASGENLILLDEVPLNLSPHILGLISNISSDIIKSADIYKGGYPAEYGGRTSSVVDIKTLDPLDKSKENKHKQKLSLGLISSSYSLSLKDEKEKVGVLFSARTSALPGVKAIIDNINNKRNDEKIKPDMSTNNYFYDAYLKTTFSINKRASLKISAGSFFDKIIANQLSINSKSDYNSTWHNRFVSMTQKYNLSQKSFFETNLNASAQLFQNYNNSIITNDDKQKEFEQYNNDILSFKASVKYTNFITNNLKLYTGIVYDASKFQNADTVFNTSISRGEKYNYTNFSIAPYGMLKGDLFNDKLNVNVGLRTVKYSNNKRLHLEPRIILGYHINKNVRLTTTMSKISQQNQILTKESIGIPYQIWVPSNEELPISSSEQLSVGSFYTQARYNFGVELFIKRTNNLIYPTLGSTLFVVNPSGQRVIKDGVNRSSGAEINAMYKPTKNSEVRFACTYMISKLQFSALNNNRAFNNYSHRPINLNLQYNRQITDRWKFNGTFVFMSGLPLTVPNGYFPAAGKNIFFRGSASRSEFNEINLFTSDFIGGPWQYAVSDINNYRTENYHRLDISFTKTKIKRQSERSTSFGIYNVYFHNNPFITYLTNVDNKFKLQSYSLFNFIPFINYSISF